MWGGFSTCYTVRKVVRWQKSLPHFFYGGKMEHRAMKILNKMSNRYPGSWKIAEMFRDDPPSKYPRWCYLPMGGWHTIAIQHESDPVSVGALTAQLSAIGTWRITKGIYQFNEAMFDSLCKTPMTGNLPCDVFKRLPEWCIYIETPNSPEMYGFFVHLEHDANDGHMELRFLVDSADLSPLILHLGNWTVQEAIDRAVAEADKNVKLLGNLNIYREYKTAKEMGGFNIKSQIDKMLPLVFYLCSQDPEYKGGKPQRPQPKKIKKGNKLFPASHPRVWNIGEETGDKIVRFRKRGTSVNIKGRKRPEAHIRRAHWHGYWKGRGDDKRFEFRWLPPIPVNTDLAGNENDE